MRITGSILAREALTSMQSQMRALADAQRRVSTGVRVDRPSDDPVAAAGILQSSSGLRALEQYRSNLQTGQARLAMEEGALEQVTDSLTRAKELGVAMVNDMNDAQARDAARMEVDQLAEQLRNVANTSFNGAYLFGGQYADSAPFDATGAWDPTRPPSGPSRVEIGAGIVADTNHDAQEIFIDSDVVDAVDALSTALAANDVAGVQAAMTRVDGAFDTVQELTADLGGRQARLDMAVSNLDSLEVTLQTFRSDLADADLAEAVTELVNRQGSLEAAMLANSRILDATLANYLR